VVFDVSQALQVNGHIELTPAPLHLSAILLQTGDRSAQIVGSMLTNGFDSSIFGAQAPQLEGHLSCKILILQSSLDKV
jgi:hypothetical protein